MWPGMRHPGTLHISDRQLLSGELWWFERGTILCLYLDDHTSWRSFHLLQLHRVRCQARRRVRSLRRLGWDLPYWASLGWRTIAPCVLWSGRRLRYDQRLICDSDLPDWFGHRIQRISSGLRIKRYIERNSNVVNITLLCPSIKCNDLYNLVKDTCLQIRSIASCQL